tara:strand:+ start:370 stop:600 length:231 start_codon:yes stop_codon:yes gene_type:complete
MGLTMKRSRVQLGWTNKKLVVGAQENEECPEPSPPVPLKKNGEQRTNRLLGVPQQAKKGASKSASQNQTMKLESSQ